MTARRLPVLILFVLVALAPLASAQVSLTTLGSPSTQSFDTLPASGSATWTNNSTIPGWFHARTGTGTTVVANNGSSNAGNLYSYGTGTATDRALGSVGSGNAAIGNLFWGVRLQNNTGSTITQLDVAYVGEQWRNSAAAAQTVAFSYLVGSPTVTGSLAEFQSTGTAVTALDFTSPITGGTAGALDGNLAANQVTKTFSITGLSIPNGTEVMLRWSDPDHTGADHGLSIDSFSVTPQGSGPVLPALNISDVSQVETDAATTTFTFAVTLTAPAGAGGVIFDIATADGTAQDDNPATEDNDYVANSLTGQSIPMGSTGPYNFNVTVNGDTTTEANETFFVNVSNIVGANAGDVQGLGTIQNDDISLVFIHDVQGNGAASPVPGATVSIRGIVTLLKSNGFFLQEEEGDYDADPNTSEGIFVFTSSAPTVAVGDNATVTGTVVEFNGLTEISPASSIIVNSAGNPLPAAVILTTADLPPTGGIAQSQLEKYESMRVTAASLTTVAPNDSFYDVETVLTGEPRPMREPGIPVSDPVPPDPTSGLPDCCIPIWDENPERLSVDTNGRAGSTGETLTSNVTLTSVTGPLDFSFSRYRLINEANLTRTANMSAVPVPLPAAREFTIAGYNIENFNNNATQRQKAALTVRDVLRLPDIIGTVEIFDLADLQALATEIQTISGVTYSAHLIEQDGTSEDNDQDVGFLVKTSRVSITSVTQELAAETYINPNTGLPETLHDRPPLVLRATVDPTGPSPQPVIVLVNHLRSFIDVELVAGEGIRVREKRKKQAESLADLLNDLQIANPTTPVISLGDYNAFQFNSGYDDSISVLSGTPTPDDQIVVDQSPDLVNPDFLNLLLNVPADQRYTFIFEGTPQSLDHVLVNAAADAINTAVAVARVNADFPEVLAATFASNAARPERNSDHDPIVAYFVLPASADVSVTKTDNVDPVNAGQQLTYTITVTNGGVDPAETVAWSDALPTGTTFVSLSQPGGWTCTTPAIGANGTVNCSIASLGVTSAAFDLVVAVDANVATGTVLSNTVSATTTTTETDGTNNSDTETTTVATSADLLLSKTDSPDPVNAGSNLSYQITLTNSGPSNAASAAFTDTLPAGTTFVSLSTTGPWTCTTPAVGATGTVTCSNASYGGVDFFNLVVNVDPNVAAGTVLTNTATLSSATTDPNGANNSDTATTTVVTSADIQVTKTDTPDPVTAGANLTYTINVTNAGVSDAVTVALADTVPAGTTFVSLAQPGGWSCTTPAVGGTGAIDCSIATFPASGVAAFTLVVNTSPSLADGTVITNTATVTTGTTDPSPSNNSATATTTVGTGSADVSVTKTDSPDPVTAGTTLTYTITVNNAGPSNATTVALADTIPTGTSFVSLASPAGWTCSTPPVGGTGAINCSVASLGVTNAVFTLVVNVDAALLTGSVVSNTATVTSATTDPTTGNESDTETTTVNTSADLQLTKVDTPDPVTAGTNITYTMTVTNAGPSDAATVALADSVPTGTTFVSLTSPAGWTCTTPAVGGTGAIDCSIATLPAGANPNFTLVVAVDPSLTNGTVITNTANVTTTTTDPASGNNTATATTTVGVGSADLSIAKVDSPDPVNAGADISYTITVTNAGPTNAASAAMSDTLPAGTTFVSLTSPAGWTCTTPAVGANGTISCTNPSLGSTSAVFSLVVRVAAATASGTAITNTATVSSTTADPNPGNESAVATTSVVSPASVSGTKTVTGTFEPNSTVTYTIVLTNSGPSTQQNNAGDELVDVLPSSLTLVSATATGGTAVASVGTNTVTWNGSIAAGASVTITINAIIRLDATPGTTVSNQGTINYDADGNGTNESSRQTDSPAAGGTSDPTTFVIGAAALAAIPTLDEWALLGLMALLATVAALALKR